MIKIIKQIEQFISILKPSKQCKQLNEWIDNIEKIYSQGCCLNFALALKHIFQNKYKCSIVGSGFIADNKRISEIKKLVKINQFNHYLLKVNDQKNNFALFDIFGLNCDYNDKNENIIWFDNYNQFLKIIKDINFKNENGIKVYHELTEDELKKLCKIWNIHYI